jgi:hypothetical protein
MSAEMRHHLFMVKSAIVAAFLIASVCLSSAFGQLAGGLQFPGPGTAHSAAGCSEATTFLARTTGLSGTETTAYTTLICGLVTDGTWTKFDALYIFATNSNTTARLNLVSTNFALTEDLNTPTFTVDRGYTMNPTGINPTPLGSNFRPDGGSAGGGGCAGAPCGTLNNAGYFIHIRNARSTTGGAEPAVGAGGANGNYYYFLPLNAGGLLADLNDGIFGAATAPSDISGLWFANRANSSSTVTVYRNASSYGTIANTSGAIPTSVTVSFGCLNTNTGYNTGQCSPQGDEYAAAGIGGGFSTAEMASVSNRILTYLTAVGAYP